jgi:hypothetical protein
VRQRQAIYYSLGSPFRVPICEDGHLRGSESQPRLKSRCAVFLHCLIRILDCESGFKLQALARFLHIRLIPITFSDLNHQ